MNAVISFESLTKKYGKHIAVENFSANIYAGKITGFLGPNGAGKSSALRCLVGLSAPTSGNAKIFGKPYRELDHPLNRVGTVLDNRGFHPALTGRQNLKIIAASADIKNSRIDQVLDLVELTASQNIRMKKYSLGMKQRLALAGAILGEPEILILDEPANGLDPAGIAWLRKFLKEMAQRGKTILVSSHQLAEMQNTVDQVLIINKGKLTAQGTIAEVIGQDTLENAFLKLTSEQQ